MDKTTIVPVLSQGAVVTTENVDYIVTEYGIVSFWGNQLGKAEALINAHPTSVLN